MSNYHLVCGLEIHTELKTQSKMFCGCKNDPFGAQEPNSHTCPVCLGMPGGLPVANRLAIEWTIKLGLFLGCKINLHSKFDRKNYFYPDLAKGYQISQYDQPFCYDGKIETSEGVVRIERIHLEEDTGKLIHGEVEGKKMSLIDFNRSGVPLVEIVTKPDIKSATQAAEYAKKLREAVRYLGIGDGDMEKGGMRLEANISLQTKKQHEKNELPNYKVEVKNINSFNFMQQAIAFEIERQTELLDKKQTIAQETRGFNAEKSITFSQRLKENAADYRYFPDPDIPSIVFSEEQIKKWKKQLPPPQSELLKTWRKEFDVEEKNGKVFIENNELKSWTEDLWKQAKKENVDVNKLANYMINKKIAWEVGDNTKQLLTNFKKETTADVLDVSELEKTIKKILTDNPNEVERFQNGEKKLQGFFMGQITKALADKKPDMGEVNKVLQKLLNAK